ncbi:MAG: DUF2442 domain-containing protein [Hyphomicrobium sp.]
MNISAHELNIPRALSVRFSVDALIVDLSDGRSLSIPLSWYPRLRHATAVERDNWRLIGGGEGIAWPQIEEDLSVEGLIAGRPSQESQSSLGKWLAARKA